jgi:hypothetical protein
MTITVFFPGISPSAEERTTAICSFATIEAPLWRICEEKEKRAGYIRSFAAPTANRR